MTSVEKLMVELYDNGLLVHNKKNILDELLEKAKKEHKNEIKSAYITGREDEYLDYYPEKHAEEYYNQIFKQK